MRSPSVPESAEIARPSLVFRAGLASLGGIQALIGLNALLAPRAFFDGFPLGRAWVAALPSYSEHLVRDVGALFLALAVLLLAAAWAMQRLLTVVALLAYLAFSVPHTLWHLSSLGPYDFADALGNVVALGTTVVLPVALLVWQLRAGDPGD
jgi:hypothetical protein